MKRVGVLWVVWIMWNHSFAGPEGLERDVVDGARRSNRIAALRCRPVTATTSSRSAPFSARVALRYRSRCTAAYSRRLGRVTGSSLGSEWVTVTSDVGPPAR